MENLKAFLEKKSRLKYDMNSIGTYIKEGNCDDSLQETWDKYNQELKKLEAEIALLSDPEKKEVAERRLELMGKVEEAEQQVALWKQEIQELESML
ncbi:hypothetical protein [Anaerotalea alkaliphila]|uniref:Uncharacterized protein n=1 Tax=Anaerotalea alkaliphila TaxID=2662126 RepID=A0A7X5KNT3_9FIRM|nr:hypothetical protein [Anaerotalea alkaliphila]NDL68339.1 hypothetical protein [Anaerotalea alkaliphila]